MRGVNSATASSPFVNGGSGPLTFAVLEAGAIISADYLHKVCYFPGPMMLKHRKDGFGPDYLVSRSY